MSPVRRRHARPAFGPVVQLGRAAGLLIRSMPTLGAGALLPVMAQIGLAELFGRSAMRADLAGGSYLVPLAVFLAGALIGYLLLAVLGLAALDVLYRLRPSLRRSLLTALLVLPWVLVTIAAFAVMAVLFYFFSLVTMMPFIILHSEPSGWMTAGIPAALVPVLLLLPLYVAAMYGAAFPLILAAGARFDALARARRMSRGHRVPIAIDLAVGGLVIGAIAAIGLVWLDRGLSWGGARGWYLLLAVLPVTLCYHATAVLAAVLYGRLVELDPATASDRLDGVFD